MKKIGHVKIFGYDFTFVFRHRYEKNNKKQLLYKMTMWREWKIGLFFKYSKIVGKRKFNQPNEWSNNLVKEYMVGIDLLICKAWFSVSKGVMKLNINEKNE